jgi:hypothetical protein
LQLIGTLPERTPLHATLWARPRRTDFASGR